MTAVRPEKVIPAAIRPTATLSALTDFRAGEGPPEKLALQTGKDYAIIGV